MDMHTELDKHGTNAESWIINQRKSDIRKIAQENNWEQIVVVLSFNESPVVWGVNADTAAE
jgi:hypothetical protein